jgi:hypothetical protein
MTPRALLVLIGVLAAGTVAGTLLTNATPDSVDPLALNEDGIGPLRLGLGYEDAVAAARQVAPDGFMAGVGCGGRDEVTYSGQLGGLPVTVMAMADEGRITEIELILDAPRQSDSEPACLALRDSLGKPLAKRFGAPGDGFEIRRPVSTEHLQPVGPALLVVRWFPTGGSCYVSALYGGQSPESVRLSVANAAGSAGGAPAPSLSNPPPAR